MCGGPQEANITEASSTGAGSGTVIIEQIVVNLDMKDLQAETNAKLAKMSRALSALKTNVSEIKRCACDNTSFSLPSRSTSTVSSWDYKSSPTWAASSSRIPSWNQTQHKHCQPIFASWQDLRAQFKSGLLARTGGLGKLMIPYVYETWVCVVNDLCSLGGDQFFCYVFDERMERFVPWDQHFKLQLFEPPK